MFDPAAIGTLRIGLDGDNDEPRSHRRRSAAATSSRTNAVRMALARGLRRAAAALERPAVGEATG